MTLTRRFPFLIGLCDDHHQVLRALDLSLTSIDLVLTISLYTGLFESPNHRRLDPRRCTPHFLSPFLSEPS